MLVIDLNALQTVYPLHFAQHIVLHGSHALYTDDIMRVDASLGDRISGAYDLTLLDLDSRSVGDQIVLLLSRLRAGDLDLAFLLRILDGYDAAEVRYDGKTLGLARLEELLDTGKTLCDITACHASGMEGSHGQLRTGLSDGLSGYDADRLAYLHCLTRSQVGAVALRAYAVVASACQDRPDLHRVSVVMLENLHDPCGSLGSHELIFLHYGLAGLGIHDILGKIPARHTLLKGLDGLLALLEALDLHIRDPVLALAAVCLADYQILRYIHQSPRQISRVGCSQRGIGQTLAGSVCGDEILQYVQTLTEVRLDGQLDRMTGRIRHQPSHTRQLLDLLIGTAGSRVCHHEDVVVLIQTREQVVRELIIGILPDLDDLLVALLVRDEAAVEVRLYTVYRLLRVVEQLLLGLRHGHIRDGYRHGRYRRILVSDRLDIVQHLRRPGQSVDLDDLLQYLLALLLLDEEIYLQLELIFRERPVHKSQILRDDLVEKYTSYRCIEHCRCPAAVLSGLGEANLDRRMQRHHMLVICMYSLIRRAEYLARALLVLTKLRQIVDAQHHIL